MRHSIGFFGLPGAGKSTATLSYPGPRQHVFGSSEATTAENFKKRTDIRPPMTWDYYQALTAEERLTLRSNPIVIKKIVNGKEATVELTFAEAEAKRAELMELGHARNVANFWNFLRGLYEDLSAECREKKVSYLADRTEILDNLTPFSQEFGDYVQVVRKKELWTKQDEFNGMAYGRLYANDFADCVRFFMSLPCHTALTCHVGMALPQELQATTRFLDTNLPINKKEWYPLVMGQTRYSLAGMMDWAVFMETEAEAGKPPVFNAKLIADASNVGIGKPRIQPFATPGKLHFPKNEFYRVFNAALETYTTTGVPVKQEEMK